MTIILKEEKGPVVEIPSEENHLAVCIGVWDMGKQRTDYNGEEKINHKLLIRWEIDEDITEGEYEGKKKCINKFYNMSLHEKSTLRGQIEAWTGKLTPVELAGYDVESLVGKACMLNVIHNENNGRTYANVASVSKVPKGLTVFEADNLDEYMKKEPEFIQKIRDKFAESLIVEDKEVAPF